ncbi:hypothetical protein GHK39_13265 [Sinorhizobium medicae]|uniref:hypothetical protein n=1 Tax=Sinorhizobium medicae TaxID=110321 RepID=UPI00129633FB|nr:hypothetical protein [Sinorhizobium medicae]MQV85559.1 hypothetical protein [Sinorhizobium medicae]MQV93048.1 hypothetical protein [Sinorhizobium medicae]
MALVDEVTERPKWKNTNLRREEFTGPDRSAVQAKTSLPGVLNVRGREKFRARYRFLIVAATSLRHLIVRSGGAQGALATNLGQQKTRPAAGFFFRFSTL